MTYAITRKLIETRVNAYSTGFATAWENVPYSPVAGTPWQRVTLLPTIAENPTMGDGFRRDPGLLEVLLFYPKNGGSQAALARAEVLLAAFKRGTALVDGTQRVLIDAHPYVSATPPDDSWFIVPVNIPYTVDSIA